MKKSMLSVALVLVVGAMLAGGGVSRGAGPEPLLSGAYGIDYQLIGGGLWCHEYTINFMDPTTGEFSGTGRYIPDPAYVEIITGKFDGSVITFHVLYTGFNAGYTVDAIGTVDANGQLSGTATSPGQEFTWTCSRNFAAPDPAPAPVVAPPPAVAPTGEPWWSKAAKAVYDAVRDAVRQIGPSYPS